MKTPEVWVCIPTALKDHVDGQISKWKSMGYLVALLTDTKTADGKTINPGRANIVIHCMEYPGVWRSWNILAKAVMAAGADIAVLAGDDTDPDQTTGPGVIGAQYLERFPSGEGVLQPCGDQRGDLIDGWRNAGRICGSPWVGRGWVQEGYSGYGPVCDLYHAFYADEELLNLAGNRGVLWRREDLTQKHLHWSWGYLPKQDYHDRNQVHWDADHALFEERRKLPQLKSGRWDKLPWYMKGTGKTL